MSHGLNSRLKGWSANIIDSAFRNLLIKPKLLARTIASPSTVLGESYFPELPRKSRKRVLAEQLWNIIRYGAIDEYYYMYGMDVLGHSRLRDYVLYPEFMRARDRLNLSDPHNDSSILRNKLYFEAVANTLGIPTPANIAYVANGRLILLHGERGKAMEWEKAASVFPEGNLYFKEISGECGKGIFKIEINGGKIFEAGKEIDGAGLKELCSGGMYLVQQELNQHPEMKRIYPKSVNTLRLTTVRNLTTGELEILPVVMRIGAHGNYVDNFSRGGAIVQVDDQTARLDKWGLFKPGYGMKQEAHPDSGVSFASFEVPFYQEAKDMARYFHSFLNLHSIGWDIAIGPEGPIFIEGNDNWEINLPQSYKNPFRSEFHRLFPKR